MKTICMYCNSLKADDGLNDGRVSHGICLTCKPVVEQMIQEIIKGSNHSIEDIQKACIKRKEASA